MTNKSNLHQELSIHGPIVLERQGFRILAQGHRIRGSFNHRIKKPGPGYAWRLNQF